MKTINERPAFRVNGFLMFAVVVTLFIYSIRLFWTAAAQNDASFPGPLWYGIGVQALIWILAVGLFTVQPNQAKVVIFLGKYAGSVREDGFWWTNPFTVRKKVSLRVHNFNSDRIKVNDAVGNPIEIAAVVVWRVVDSAKALFDVENYGEFVSIQSETAIRALASRYPYDLPEENVSSLRGSPDEIAASLKHEVEARLEIAGLEVMEARLSHLAYAPEIAQAMLRRQQAQAIIAARQQMVEGAVGMVEMALKRLSEHQVLDMDEERKAAMVSNLLVVLTSEQATQPVVNTGTLYG